VALVVIMVELTGDINYIVPIMVACLLAKWVGDALGTGGIYEEQIRLKGYPYLDSKGDYSPPPSAQTVLSVMRPREGDPPMCVLAEHGNTLTSLGMYDIVLYCIAWAVNPFWPPATVRSPPVG
jgi:chloride channel 3/4/5